MKPRIAVCFFGITRSLGRTMPSIESNVLQPARELGSVRVYSHFFRQQEIDIAVSPAYTERGRIDPEEYRLLQSDWLALEEPDNAAVQATLAALRPYGDAWNSNFVLIRNLVHQLHSLHAVTEAALADDPAVVLFCRPDLQYHDSLRRPLRRVLASRRDLVLLPYWQSWRGGLNDRFALCRGRAAIAAYGKRLDVAEAFCREENRPVHAESLLRFALALAGVRLRLIGARATRIRVDGRAFEEDFRHPLLRRIDRRLRLLTGRGTAVP